MENFLTRKMTWNNMELGLLKITAASAYLIVGAYFHKIVKDYFNLIFILFIVTVVWTVYIWIKKMRVNHK